MVEKKKEPFHCMEDILWVCLSYSIRVLRTKISVLGGRWPGWRNGLQLENIGSIFSSLPPCVLENLLHCKIQIMVDTLLEKITKYLSLSVNYKYFVYDKGT